MRLQLFVTAVFSALQGSINRTEKGIVTELAKILVPESRRALGLWTAMNTGVFGFVIGFGHAGPAFLTSISRPMVWAVAMIVIAALKFAAVLRRWLYAEIVTYTAATWFWSSIGYSYGLGGVAFPHLGAYVVATLTNITLVVWTYWDIRYATARPEYDPQQLNGPRDNADDRDYRTLGRAQAKPYCRESADRISR